MSETRRPNHIRLFILIGVAALLVLIYVGAGFLLPASIQGDYLGRNCTLVLDLDKLYTNLYPAPLVDKSIAASVAECALYSLATDAQQRRAWQDSYDAYKRYAGTYPNGLFTGEAHEQSAAVLAGLAYQQMAANQYAEAIGNLDRIAQEYTDTAILAQTNAAIPKAYTAWGSQLRDSGDFAGAEKVFKDYEVWAQSAQNTEELQYARLDLARTYLAEGQALQTQAKFDQAKVSLDQAMALDPDPSQSAGPSAQAKAAQAGLYAAWGDSLAGKKDFAGAIDRYKTVITLVGDNDRPAAQDGVANGYVQWAAGLSAAEDFLGALKQLDVAATDAATEKMKAAIATARTDTYSAFSMSSGDQARQAMADAVQTVCVDQSTPDLPIFGLDKKNIQAAVSGAPNPLPANVAATTPGSMHYVVCITPSTKVLETKTLLLSSDNGHISSSTSVKVPRSFVRDQSIWAVMLVEIDGGTSMAAESVLKGGAPVVARTILKGAVPDTFPPLSDTHFNIQFVPLQSIHGPNPDMVDLANWLLTVMK